MKKTIRLMLMAAGLVASCSYGFAGGQAPAGAPAGATGQCKDGTYSTAATKQGACRGHQGIKDWYVAAPSAAAKSAARPAPAAATTKPAAMPPPAAAKSAPAMAAPAPAAAPVAAKPVPAAAKGTAAMAPAAGGGPGMVWLNLDSKIYHCPGSQFYGKTKQGKYVSEADAKAMGARPDHNKPCTK